MVSNNARETAYRRIKQNIIELVFKPGDCLIDKQLAEEFGMSRTPIREALMILSFEKLIEILPQRGTFVTPIDVAMVELEQFIRCELEKQVLLRVCDLLTPKHQGWYCENLHLQKFYDEIDQEDKQQKLYELDNQFHRFAFLIDGKERHIIYMDKNTNHIERLRILSLKYIPQNGAKVFSDHEKIKMLLFEKKKDALRQALETHLNLYREHLTLLRHDFPEFFQ